jgi:hypothetical protein
LLITIRRYRCTGRGHVSRQDTSRAAEPRAKLSRRALRWALEGIVCQRLTVARVAEGLGVSWNTANDAVLAEGRRVLIEDPHRFDGVRGIGVDGGHRGRKGDPPYAARRTLHTGSDLLTDKQRQRLTVLFADDEYVEVEATWGIYQHMIAAYREPDRKRGRELMQQLIGSISHSVPTALREVIDHPRPDPQTANRRRAGLLRPARHLQRADRGDPMPTPARAGPAARATLTMTMSSRLAAANSFRGTSSVISPCPRRRQHGLAGSDRESEREEQGRRHHPQGCERGERNSHHDEVVLHAEQQPAPVEGVGQHAGRQGKKHHRRGTGSLNQRDDGGRVGVMHDRPLRSHRLEPPAINGVNRWWPGLGQEN